MLKKHLLESWFLILALTLLAAAPAWAERLEEIPNPKVRDNTWVTDLAGRLQPQTIAEANSLISSLEKSTKAEIALVVIRTLGGQSERQFATDLLRLWGIGKLGANNGLLFLWAADDRRVVVEVGYGLEGILPDGKVGSILDRYTISYFKAGEFDKGIIEGLKAFAAVIRSEPVEVPPINVQSYKKDPVESPPVDAQQFRKHDDGLSPFIWIFAVLAASAGSFIGYRYWRRYHGRACAQCQSAMARLSEKNDDEFLDKGELKEEELGSVDYDVWKCSKCSHHLTLRYPKWFSGYHKCPQCDHRTCWSNETTIRAATTVSEGLAQVSERCGFCKYHQAYKKTIARISTSNTSSGSSSSGSSWTGSGSGGGGFSGGSSSGSFGGGSSGGGGASRGY